MTVETARPETPPAPQVRVLPNGPAAAAFLSAGIGSFALGLMTTLAEASPALRSTLTLSVPAGPLSGKTTVAVVAWLVAWGLLHMMWRSRSLDWGRISWWTYGLIALGLIGTFPPFFELFAP